MDADYATFHRDGTNLVIHVFAVPVFVLGVVGAIWFAATARFFLAAAFAILPAISLAVQGAGHRKEPNPPRPFIGPANFVGRILAEQFFRFPLYVVSGGWAKALSESKQR